MGDWLFGGFLGAMHAWAVYGMNETVPEPYMDEQFHVAQTRQYCDGNYDQWHPLITTPPALYFITLIFHKILSFLAVDFGLCFGGERLVNSLLVPACFVGLCRLRRRLQPTLSTDMTENRLSALVVLCLPVLLDTSLLFYTDLVSLTALAWALGSMCPFHSFVAFLVALFTRQTNIVWVPFYCFPFVWPALMQLYRRESHFLGTLILLLRRLCLHISLCLGFLAFVYYNDGSIVLGDRSAHHPVFHAPQMLYFCTFAAASALPQFVLYSREFFQKNLSFRRRVATSIFSIVALLAVHFFTFAHPYLLADNRHFTFYIWQRVFQRHWLIKYALIPIYALCANSLWDTMATDTETKVAFFIAAAGCLVPAHLLEFRYFIAPFALWRLSLGKQSPQLIYAELALHAVVVFIVNAMALHLFLNHPFKWTLAPARWQRFMW